jgi:hypothetical protein
VETVAAAEPLAKATGDLRQPCIVVAQGNGTGTPRAEFRKLRPAVDAGALENRPRSRST